jgi:hypothetical protein
LPIHLLAKQGRVAIRITQRTAQGAVDLHWEVSYNDHYGPPRQLAYKLDTLVVNRQLDALGRPLPPLIRLDSLRQLCQVLGINTGKAVQDLKKAFHQNAGAYIVAKLRYRSVDGRERHLEAGFTRYSVIFVGERLPTGQRADAVYLVLHDLYREVLNHAPVRPLDYDYLKALPPTAQRFYELVSYKIFAALAHHQPAATLRYSEYCLLAPQPRYTTYDQVKKQLYKVHKPHLASDYLAQVCAERTTDRDGHPDWWLHYVPGPKARAEYAAFTRPSRPGAAPETARQGVEPFPDTPPGEISPMVQAGDPAVGADPVSLATSPATVLVQYFYQRFHGVTASALPTKALYQAKALIAQHGEAAARFMVDFAWQQAQTTRYPLEHFGGILPYAPRALAAYEARHQHLAQQRAAARDDQQRAQYETFWQQEVGRIRAMLSPDDLAALEATVREQLTVSGAIPAYAIERMVRVESDTALAERYAVPSFETWQRTQEAHR